MSESDMNVNEMLQEVLGNPDAMKKISELASGLFGGGKEENDTVSSAPVLLDKVRDYMDRGEGGEILYPEQRKVGGAVQGILGGLDLGHLGDENQIRLIKALRPYLSEERRNTADAIVKLLKLLQLANLGKQL